MFLDSLCFQISCYKYALTDWHVCVYVFLRKVWLKTQRDFPFSRIVWKTKGVAYLFAGWPQIRVESNSTITILTQIKRTTLQLLSNKNSYLIKRKYLLDLQNKVFKMLKPTSIISWISKATTKKFSWVFLQDTVQWTN